MQEQYRRLRDDNIDIAIISKGGLSLYYNEQVLGYDIDLLRNKGYRIVEFEGDFISTEDELLFDLQDKLGLPDWCANGFDSLDDGLIDYEVDADGLVLVFRHLNHLDAKTLQVFLDILAHRIRRKFATGARLLTLLQVDDRKFTVSGPIGALNFYLWNDREWFESDRH